jgi:class 3 adenylate cyclase
VLRHAEKLSAEENAYRSVVLSLRDGAVVRLCMALALPYHITSLATDPLYVSASDLPLFRTMHVVLIACYSVWLLKLQRTRLDSRWYLWMLQLGFTAFFALILHRTIARGSAPDALLATNGLTMISGLMLMLCPFHNAVLALTGGFFIGFGAAATAGGPEWALRWLPIYALVLTVLVVYQLAGGRRLGSKAVKEYRTLRQVAPAQVVRQATAAQESLDEVFKPAMRPVACISTDWREFQRFSRAKEPQVVAHTLNDYYALCEQLLARICPEGNYYSDWIADELFIVIFGKKGGTTRRLTQQAVQFGRELLAAKPGFLKTHSMPEAVDVGISIGGALVGMMGPGEHRKATALGEIPGIARRMQLTGKLLRRRFGQRDRILVHEYALGWLKGESDMQRFTLPHGEKLRDLDVSEIYFIEAAVDDGADARKTA